MKALTVKQPWAQLIVSGIKNIENRSWKTNFRGRTYIHASQKPVPMNGMPDGFNPTTEQWSDLVRNHWNIKDGRLPDLMAANINSAIIGEVDIIDCVQNHPSIWAEQGVWNWVLANSVCYDEPILNVKGAQSFWQYIPVS